MEKGTCWRVGDHVPFLLSVYGHSCSECMQTLCMLLFLMCVHMCISPTISEMYVALLVFLPESLALVSFYNVFYKVCWAMEEEFWWQYVIYDTIIQVLSCCTLSRYGSLYLDLFTVYVNFYDEGAVIQCTMDITLLLDILLFIHIVSRQWYIILALISGILPWKQCIIWVVFQWVNLRSSYRSSFFPRRCHYCSRESCRQLIMVDQIV